MQSRLLLTAFLFALGANFFWAGNAVVGKLVATTVPAFSLYFWRWVIAFLILLPFAGRQFMRHRQSLWQLKGLIALLALLSVTLYNAMQYLALHTTSPGNVGIVTATMPMFILFLSFLINGTTIHVKDVIGMSLALTGIIFMMVFSGKSFSGPNVGDMVMLFAVLAFAVYSVKLKQVPHHIPTPALLLSLIGIGVAFSLPFYIWDLAQGNTVDWFAGNTPWALGYVAIFPSLGSYFLWNIAVKRGGPMVTATAINMLPVFALFLSYVFLDTGILIEQIIAMLLVFTGTMVSLFMPQRQSAAV